jgi:hypothetical protein
MKVKDLFTIVGCWDVYEDIADEVGIAFDSDGKNPLTEQGKRKFKTALNMEVKAIYNGMVIVDTTKYFKDKHINIDDYDFETRDTTPKEILNLIDLFWSLAGYCSVDEYNKYFKDKIE